MEVLKITQQYFNFYVASRFCHDMDIETAHNEAKDVLNFNLLSFQKVQ